MNALNRLLYISIGIAMSGFVGFAGWCLYQYYLKFRYLRSNEIVKLLKLQFCSSRSDKQSRSKRSYLNNVEAKLHSVEAKLHSVEAKLPSTEGELVMNGLLDRTFRQDPQTTTRVYFDSLSGINETRSYYLADSEIDDVNLNPNDNHNVHNVSIINSIKKKLPLLYDGDHQSYTFVKVVQQIKDSLDKGGKKSRYPYISKVLRFILESKASYSSRQIKEFEIIRLIWARINHPENSNQHSLLVNEFLSQLNDCFQTEEQSVCCLEGRIVRYFQVLELHDYQAEIWPLVPLWIYKTEIENRCAKALNEMVETLALEDQLIYFKQEPNMAEKEKIDQWNKGLVDGLNEQFTELYGEKLEARQLHDLTRPCFQAIGGT